MGLDHPATDELELTAVLHALSDPQRLAIVRALAGADEPRRCGAFGLAVTKSTLTHHFRVLRRAGVIAQREDGTAKLNSLRHADLDARFPGLLDAILAPSSALFQEGRRQFGTERLSALNQLDPSAAQTALLGCCGSRRWAEQIARARPYADAAAVHEAAEQAFDGLEEAEWREAFAAHARIGEPHAGDPRGAGEQSAVSGASSEDRRALAAANAAYEERFGHVFLICAAGLDAAATLAALDERYDNTPAVELGLAGAEQRKITRLRLRDLVGG